MSGNAEDLRHVPHHDAGGPSATTTAGETFPTMPHLDLSDEDLKKFHPRILAPPEEQLYDLVQDDHDAVYQHGFKIAKELQEQADELGRKRHPDLKHSPGKPLRSMPPKSVRALVASSTTAIARPGYTLSACTRVLDKDYDDYDKLQN